jgi:hypothetical protein
MYVCRYQLILVMVMVVFLKKRLNVYILLRLARDEIPLYTLIILDF